MRLAAPVFGRTRAPRAVEGVELNVGDGHVRRVPAIDRPLDYITQLTDIARPRMILERIHHVRREPRPALPVQFCRHAPPEIFGQDADIALTHPQRRQGDDFEAQPVEQVGAELAACCERGQIIIGRRHDPHIDPDRARGTDARDLAIFDRAQQSLLRAHRQCAEFVKEQRPAVRLLEPPHAGLGRTGKGACFMPEQLGLDQRFGKRGAVHRHQRFVPAARQAVKAFGDQFFTRTALTDHQHGTVHRGCAAGALDRVEKGP